MARRMRRVVAPIVLLIALVVVAAWLMHSPAGPLTPTAPQPEVEGALDAATLTAGEAASTQARASGTDPARTPVQDAEAAFVVRGRALRAMNTPYPLACLDAQRFVGGAAEGEPDLRAELSCDADGRFEWRLPAPTTVLCLHLSSALPHHVGWPTKVVVARGDPAPQDLEVYVAPLDRADRP